MRRWSESLIKERVDFQVFDENGVPLSAGERKEVQEIRFFCEGVFPTVERVKRVRDSVKAVLKDSGSAGVKRVGKAVLAELKEIEQDLKFAKSRRGAFILFCNDYAQRIYETLRTDSRLDDVYLMAHGVSEAIVLTGRLQDFADLERVISMLKADVPGLPVKIEVVVGAG